MAKGRTKTSILWNRLRTKYRLVLMHDKTFEVQASLRLSPLNVIILFSTLFVVIGLLVYMTIVFTPLKNLVVGYSEVATTRQITENKRITDSMAQVLNAYDMYYANLQKRLKGETDTIIPIDSLQKKDYSKVVIGSPSELDLEMREQIEREDLFNLSVGDPREATGEQNLQSLHFFPPIKGTITSGFSNREGHYGTDVVAPENTPIKACLDGVVLDTYWNYESGNVVIIQHDHGLISFYKHNAQVLKHAGAKVRAGDVIAIIGNTGEMSSGPHLHFELWHDKTPLNPTEFINFN